ncbi:GNAT family N-acetyltransferase [Croceivirga thetidis]|uniref:GNAT family N-acetyltransferase n=1 Tax=Croceivirga thetidis TaxID=2721623 RepID=A0ABX1GT04_9FLAO|nr:GNAT family N-acetyltransferase [Croceivirga thetidis]NKI32749.1 GNAT family N-acetyltransferase [Croceivirga thetidis]
MEQIQIVDFKDSYSAAFKTINQEWIEQYFEMEEMDRKALEHPKEYILDKGGHIVVALLDDEPVGVCALIKMNHPEFDFELAKMGVSPKAQGMGVGYKLGKSIIEKAQNIGAKTIYLESNTILKPAINLYRKLGFTEIKGIETPYQRCDIQMIKYIS